MLYTKISPVGIDIQIQRLQTLLFAKLPAIWGISDTLYECYGRCYRNQKDEGYVAEVYKGNNEYKEVYVDDRISAISFFGLTDQTIDMNKVNKAEVHLIFWVDIKKVKPALLHRGDEEVRKDVEQIIKNKYGFQLSGIDLGIENVLRDYPGSLESDKVIKYRDMHPFHCFRFNFDLLYNISQC